MKVPALVLAILALVPLVAALGGGGNASASRDVSVTLADTSIEVDRAVIPAGRVKLDTRNAGSVDHELVIVRTDKPADKLPIGLEGVSYKLSGKLILGRPHSHSEHERGLTSGHIRPDGRRRDAITLTPGKYVLLCNLPGHYAAGQRASLTVR